jgi:hypothetical protein
MFPDSFSDAFERYSNPKAGCAACRKPTEGRLQQLCEEVGEGGGGGSGERGGGGSGEGGVEGAPLPDELGEEDEDSGEEDDADEGEEQAAVEGEVSGK